MSFMTGILAGKLAVAAAIATAMAPTSCSGSVTIESVETCCVELVGGEINYTESGGVLKVSGDGATLQVKKRNIPECPDCEITGEVKIHVDANGNGEEDKGELVREYPVGNPPVSIGLEGTTVDGASSDTTIRVTYCIEACCPEDKPLKRTIVGSSAG